MLGQPREPRVLGAEVPATDRDEPRAPVRLPEAARGGERAGPHTHRLHQRPKPAALHQLRRDVHHVVQGERQDPPGVLPVEGGRVHDDAEVDLVLHCQGPVIHETPGSFGASPST